MTPEPSRCLNGPIVGAVGRGLYSIATLGTLVALVLLALFSSGDAHAQGTATTDPPGANLDVSLFTFGPGEEVWERFGHNAIQIRDRSSGEAVLYNYGIFDFGQKNFFVNFARGLMTYRIAAGDPADELPVYVAEGRWIVEQKLNLTPAQRAQLAGFLANNARPENAEYRYDYFRANCSTRVRDALDAAAGGAIKAQTIAPSRGFTYRIDADRLMRPDPLVMLAMDAGLGPYADQRLSNWDESFVPMELMRHMREVQHREAWLVAAANLLTVNYDLAIEVLNNRRLVKGYSDTHARGLSKFDRVMSALPMLRDREDGAAWMKRLRQAALLDENGAALDGALKTVETL